MPPTRLQNDRPEKHALHELSANRNAAQSRHGPGIYVPKVPGKLSCAKATNRDR
jgi:hypothetical protein